MLRGLYNDWARAPISGTAAVVMMGIGTWRSLSGSLSGGEHMFILALLVLIGRK